MKRERSVLDTNEVIELHASIKQGHGGFDGVVLQGVLRENSWVRHVTNKSFGVRHLPVFGTGTTVVYAEWEQFTHDLLAQFDTVSDHCYVDANVRGRDTVPAQPNSVPEALTPTFSLRVKYQGELGLYAFRRNNQGDIFFEKDPAELVVLATKLVWTLPWR